MLTCEQNEVLENEKFAPITSFDWNHIDSSVVVASNFHSSYFSCTVWDVDANKREEDILLKRSDSKVYDVAFQQSNKDIFASVGEDGLMRLFDLRSLDKFTEIYRTPEKNALFRVEWNLQNTFYVAGLFMLSQNVVVLDVRFPTKPVLELCGHAAQVNAINWAPHSGSHLCTVGDDKQSYVWDLSRPTAVREPMLSYSSASKINNAIWSLSRPEYVALATGKRLEVLKV